MPAVVRASREFTITSRIFRTRNYPAALRRVTRYLERDPGDADLLQMRAMTNLRWATTRRPIATQWPHSLTEMSGTGRPSDRCIDRPTKTWPIPHLEDYVSANPNAARPAFLFAYHNLMLGNNEAARREFGHVAAIDPANEAARAAVVDWRAAASTGPSHSGTFADSLQDAATSSARNDRRRTGRGPG